MKILFSITAWVLCVTAWTIGTGDCRAGEIPTRHCARAMKFNNAPYSDPFQSIPNGAMQMAMAGRVREYEKEFTNSLGMIFVHIPGGTFMMGSPEQEKGREPDELLHSVEFSKGFYMQTTEVTRGQWRTFVADTGFDPEAEAGDRINIIQPRAIWKKQKRRDWATPGFDQDDLHPVTCVSWRDVQIFITWLNRKTGDNYRLPTEAEWEYACRAGSQSARFWGEAPEQACQYANMADLTARNRFPRWDVHGCGDGFIYTAAAGSFESNQWGLYDMLGNVWEWCQDRYGPYPVEPEKDPKGALSGRGRVFRGGSWSSHPVYCRSANRTWNWHGYRSINLGFRLVREERN